MQEIELSEEHKKKTVKNGEKRIKHGIKSYFQGLSKEGKILSGKTLPKSK